MKYYFIFFPLFFLTSSCKKDKTEQQQQQTLLETGTITDIRDGQIYATVKIGDQWWMAQDLNYNAPNSWYYNNDSISYAKTYGRLYLWSTAMDGSSSSNINPSNVRGISPAGWHIPSDAEWRQLTTYLANHNITGDDLKEIGTAHWKPTNTGTNTTGFNSVPAGTIYNNGANSANINGYVTYISATIDPSTGGAWGFGLNYNSSTVSRGPIGLQDGWTVRCVKD